MNRTVFFNGELAPEEDVRISAFDRGFLYGDGLFETIRVYGGVPFRWDEHIERMKKSAGRLGMGWSEHRAPDKSSVAGLLEKNGLKDAYLRITMTRGLHTGHIGLPSNGLPTVVMVVEECRPPSEEDYKNGVDAIMMKIPWLSPLAAHKTLSYLPYLAAKQTSLNAGAREAVLCDHFGRLTEGASSNVFAVFAGRIFTPPPEGQILDGVARRVAIKAAGAAGIKVTEDHVNCQDMADADEIFITNSIVEVLPVTRLDGVNVGPDGKVGPVSRKVLEGYREEVRKEVEAGSDG